MTSHSRSLVHAIETQMPQQLDKDPESLPESAEGSPGGGSIPSAGPSATASDSEGRNASQRTLGCQISGCQRALACPYDRRCKVCQFHRTATQVIIQEEKLRFCHKCGRFEPLELFETTRRSCRRQLEEHNRQQRRRRQASQDARREHAMALPPAKRAAHEMCIELPPGVAVPTAPHLHTVVTPVANPSAATFETLLPDMTAAITTPEFQVLKPLLDQLAMDQLLDPALWSLIVQFLKELRGEGVGAAPAPPPAY